MAKKEHSWNIYRLRGTPAQFVGIVEAPDEATAIRKAIEEFQITNRLVQVACHNPGRGSVPTTQGWRLPARDRLTWASVGATDWLTSQPAAECRLRVTSAGLTVPAPSPVRL